MTKNEINLVALSIFVDRDFFKTEEQKKTVDIISLGIAEQLKAINPSFDTARFITACGVK